MAETRACKHGYADRGLQRLRPIVSLRINLRLSLAACSRPFDSIKGMYSRIRRGIQDFYIRGGSAYISIPVEFAL